MGYSAGGCLAFDVAKELEQRGKKVSDIIMVDGYKNKTKVDGTYTEYCGAGPHMEMLFADYAKVNMNIIFSILNSVEEKRFPNEQ